MLAVDPVLLNMVEGSKRTSLTSTVAPVGVRYLAAASKAKRKYSIEEILGLI